MATSPAIDFLITAGSASDLVSQPLVLGREPEEQSSELLPVGAGPRERVRRQLSRPLPPVRIASAPTRERGLVLKELTLNRAHRGLLDHIPFLEHRERIVWIATSFDLGRRPVFVFPRQAASAQLATIELSPGETFRWTLGEGAPVAPLHSVTGGIVVSIYVAASNAGARGLGEHLTDAAHAVENDDDLAAAIDKIVANPGAASAEAIAQVALTIPKILGAVLAKAKDDVVGVFQGYFPAASDWTGELEQSESGATIVLGELPPSASGRKPIPYEATPPQ